MYKKVFRQYGWYKISAHTANLIPKNSLHFILTFLMNQSLSSNKNEIGSMQVKHKNFLSSYYKAFQISKRLVNKGKSKLLYRSL